MNFFNVIHTIRVLTINDLPNICTVSYTIYDISTPTCFGTQVPYSGSQL
jgi:hypothetical protein